MNNTARRWAVDPEEARGSSSRYSISTGRPEA